ncbi:MAG TPA: hypothetical protein VJJ52_02760 [Candidatus Nanoarchaeia archaeon]|nr:hypothetical protein [Candidatus Nanoarchaeia archaeon]
MDRVNTIASRIEGIVRDLQVEYTIKLSGSEYLLYPKSPEESAPILTFSMDQKFLNIPVPDSGAGRVAATSVILAASKYGGRIIPPMTNPEMTAGLRLGTGYQPGA